MSGYIVAKIESEVITEAWGPFPTPEAAADWLGRFDDRLLDFIWDTKGDHWFASLEEGDLEKVHFQIRRLESVEEPAESAG